MTEEVDVGSSEQVKKGKKKHQLKREQEVEDIKKLLESSWGRYFVWRILQECDMFKTLSGYDPHEMYRRSGKRDVGLWIVKELEDVSEDAYLELVRESKHRESS